MAHDEAGDPTIRAGMDVLKADFVVDIDRPKFLGELDGHEYCNIKWRNFGNIIWRMFSP